MSLNWQFEDKARFAAMSDEDKKLNDAFIWGCMAVDLRGITEKNAEEWQWRYEYAVKQNGAYVYLDHKPFIPTLDEVRKRIGLHTNCTQRTRKQFVAKVDRIHADNEARYAKTATPETRKAVSKDPANDFLNSIFGS